MSWPSSQPLPPVVVMEMNGLAALASALHELSEAPDLKGRTDRRLLSFTLHFAVTDIPAQGWRTYIASYRDTPAPLLETGTESAELIVVETLRHGGDLPPVGNF